MKTFLFLVFIIPSFGSCRSVYADREGLMLGKRLNWVCNQSLNETTHGYCAQVELQFRPNLVSSTHKSFNIRVKE